MLMRKLLSIFLALFVAGAAVADAKGPVATAEGRLAGAYQDDVDEAFVFLVLKRDDGFTYACIQTNGTANVLRGIQPLIGRTVALSGHEITPTIVNRAITKRQISVSSLADIRVASGEDSDPFAVPSLDAVPPSLDELAVADDAASGRLSTVAKMIKSCLVDLRRCLWDLRNDVLDEPNFAEAIRRTVEPVARDAKLHVRLDGRRALLSDATAHALLNVVRELVANAVGHGAAKNVRIEGEVHTGDLHLSVRDDGCGFDPDKRPGTSKGHFGIDGIKARLERIGGTLTVESSPGNGTNVAVDIKISNTSHVSRTS